MKIRNAADGLARLRKLKKSIASDFLTMGEIMSVLRANQWIEPYGSFRDLVEAELGLSYRKAMYLISLHELVDAGHLSREEALDMGWSKAAQLISMDPKSREFRYVVENHRYLSQVAVMSIKKTGVLSSEPRPQGSVLRTFAFSGPQLNELDDAMSLVGYSAYSRKNGLTREAALLTLVRAGVASLAKKRKRAA